MVYSIELVRALLNCCDNMNIECSYLFFFYPVSGADRALQGSFEGDTPNMIFFISRTQNPRHLIKGERLPPVYRKLMLIILSVYMIHHNTTYSFIMTHSILPKYHQIIFFIKLPFLRSFYLFVFLIN